MMLSTAIPLLGSIDSCTFAMKRLSACTLGCTESLVMIAVLPMSFPEALRLIVETYGISLGVLCSGNSKKADDAMALQRAL